MRPFRFGVALTALTSARQWADKCRRAERLGYDVIAVPDHLGYPAPFPALAAAAQATERPRLSTFVLDTAFYQPALLVRDATTLDLITSGRLELGLGAGYARAEAVGAGLPWQRAGLRVDRLRATVDAFERAVRRGGEAPGPEAHERGSGAGEAARPGPPLLIGGNGDRVLRLAARRADIVGFSGATQARGAPEGTLAFLRPEEFDARVRFFTEAAGDRDAVVERNLLIPRVLPGADPRAALGPVLAHEPGLALEQALAMPTVLAGTPAQMAERLRELRERHRLSYFTVREPMMEDFARVIDALGHTGADPAGPHRPPPAPAGP